MPCRVMIIEDESLVAEDLQACLTRCGYEVVGTADTAAAARELARTTAPDLALLDIRLKDAEDGIALAGDLRAAQIGFVYLTAHADEATLQRAGHTEPLGYVLKPFDPRELHPVLEMARRRHATERELRSMGRWLATTLRSIGDGVVVADPSLCVTYVNPVAERLTGLSLSAAVGQPIDAVLPLYRGADGTRIASLAGRAVEQGAVVHLEEDAELRRADGRRLPVEDSAAPIRDEGGQVQGAVVVLRDATGRRQLQQQRIEAAVRLEEAKRQQSLGVLASGLAHDINNQLAAILGHAELCRGAAPPGLHEPLDQIVAGARAAAELCARVLSGAGAGPLDLRAVDLTTAIAAAVRRERGQLPPTVRIEVHGDPVAVALRADAAQLDQVLGNLLRNAVEAIGDLDGVVAVRYGPIELPNPWWAKAAGGREMPAGAYGWFEVADDGPGMPADVLARVFEPFFTTKFEGRGLGLASVHGIVHRHGGVIQAFSEPGSGAVFRVLWPADRAASPASAPPPVPSLSVAVVDDAPDVRRVLGSLVAARGASPTLLAAGDDLIAALAGGQHFDAVVLDVVMPGAGGLEVLQRLRRIAPGLPVLLVSGNGSLPAELAATDRHLAFLAKPFTGDELWTALQRLVPTGR